MNADRSRWFVVVAAAAVPACVWLGCSSRAVAPNLPPPEYEAPRSFTPPATSTGQESAPEAVVAAPDASGLQPENDGGAPAAPDDAAAEAR